MVVLLQIILSIILEDNNIPRVHKTNLKKFRKSMKKYPEIKSIIKANFIMAIFVLFVIFQALSVIKLQYDMEKFAVIQNNK